MIDEIKNYDLRVFLAFLRVIHRSDLNQILDVGETRQTVHRLIYEQASQ